jgi:Acetoacetate decarboxylase (ADC)
MLSGTADPAALAAGAPLVTDLATEPMACRDAELLQVVYEVRAEARQAMLPPALHPVNPPAITLTVLRVRDSEVGPFALAETRIVCRSGVRSRGFHVSCFVQGAEAARLLASRWGYRVCPAAVTLERCFHGTSAAVRHPGGVPLEVTMLHPQPLGPSDLQFTDTMHLTRTPTGCRLVQVERAYDVRGVERGRPALAVFDGAAWGEPRLHPSYPVSAVALAADVTFRPIRFVCRPDVNALEGTERVG